MLLTDRSIWSDEVEMLAKIHASIIMIVTRKSSDWRKYLPERYVSSATVATIPSGTRLKSITRGLSSMLDGLVAQIKAGQSGQQHS